MKYVYTGSSFAAEISTKSEREIVKVCEIYGGELTPPIVDMLKHANKGVLVEKYMKELEANIYKIIGLVPPSYADMDVVTPHILRVGEIMQLLNPATGIKPCPLCGGEANLERSAEFAWIKCNECGTRTNTDTPDAVLKLWNNRHDETPQKVTPDTEAKGEGMA